MKLPPFEYACPASLDEAVALLAVHKGEAKVLAGGQSLMPMMAFRIAQPAFGLARWCAGATSLTISGLRPPIRC
jgi:hypothetical protein